MSNYVRIEIQDPFGHWHKHIVVTNSPSIIKFSLQAALKTQLAAKSKKVRAVDEETGTLIDMQFG